MQLRFDGYFGFAGGLVDPGETPLQAVNRELQEELNWKNGAVGAEHHQFTHVNTKSKLVLHFYALEVPESEIEQIEQNVLTAVEYGEEVLGVVRVPLYTMGDAFRGFPCFLKQRFAGNAKTQLLETLVALKIVNQEYIVRALSAGPRVIT